MGFFSKSLFLCTWEKFDNAQDIILSILIAQGIIAALRRVIKGLSPNCGVLSYKMSILVFIMYLYQPSKKALEVIIFSCYKNNKTIILDIILFFKLFFPGKEQHDIVYMWNPKKMIKMNLFTKQTHRLREWTYGYEGEGWGEGIDWEFGVDMYTLLYLK